MIYPGEDTKKKTEAGSGYIHFIIESTSYRTQSLVAVEDGEKAVFTFHDNTLVVEVDNPVNIVALGSL